MAKTIIYNSSSASTVFDTDNIAVNESNGDRYVNDRDSSTIYKIDSNGAITTFLAGYQWNVIRFIGGYLYASKDLGGIYKINPTPANQSPTVAGGNGNGNGLNQFNRPVDSVTDSSGNLYVVDRHNHRIQKWASGATTGVTFAGGNGQGSNANQFNAPTGIDIDSSGNIYVCDYGNHSIQKFPSNSTSSINGTTVAGIRGNSAGTTNRLSYPNDIAIDSSGNIFVCDGSGTDRVIKFPSNSSSGTTGTVIRSGLNNPSGICLDSSDNLFIANTDNHCILRMAYSGGTYSNPTEIAGNSGSSGTGLNRLFQPNDVAVDSSGNLYVADHYNNRIMKYLASSFSSGANYNNYGTSILSVSTPVGLHIDSSDSLYVSSHNGEKVQKIFFGLSVTQITSTSGGLGQVADLDTLVTPHGFHIFNNDECYSTDTSRNRIMYWTTSATAGVQIVTGGSAKGFTVDSSGNLIVCDRINSRVLKYTKTAPNTFSQSPTVIAGGNGAGSALNQLSNPTVVKYNSDGSITVLDNDNDRVVKWASGANTGVVLSDSYTTPSDLYVYANGDLLISDVGNDTITLDDGLTAAPTMVITSSAVNSGGTNGTSAITMTFTSSLATANFTVNDISVNGGALSSFSSTSTTVYTATFTPVGSGSKSISVGANAYTDTAWGNSNTVSNTFTYTAGSAPVTSSTSLTSNNALGATKAKVGDVVTLTFVTDININSPTVAFTSGGQAITNSVTVTGSNTSWTATYTVHTSDTEGAVAISITATSTSGTQASAHTTISSGSVTMDKTAPAWSNIYPSGNTTTNSSAVQYSLSEALSSGTVTFTRTGGSAASNATVALTGAELNAGSRSLGVLTNAPTLVNSAVYSISFNGVDLSGNASNTSTASGVTFNNILPSITSVTSTTTDGYYNAGDNINITVTFNGSVNLISSGGPGGGGGGTPTMVVTLETGSTDRTVSFTSISNASSVSGTYTVQAGDTSADLAVKTIVVNDGNISNAAGNMSDFTIGSNLSSTSALVVDTTAPVISSVSPASSSSVANKNIGYTLSEQCASGTVVFTRTGGSPDSGSPHTVNLVSSELTTGVHAPAELINNPSLVSGSVYSIAFNATDLAANNATAVTSTSVTYSTDNIAPTIVISSNNVNSGGISNLDAIVLNFTISETTTNFVVGDITVSGGTLSGFTGSDKNYAATFTPNGNSSKTINVNAGVFTDAANNNNLAATQFIYTYNGDSPTVAITSDQVNHNGTYGNSEIVLTFTTSIATTNFVASDITVSNGTLTNFTATSSTVYTANFTATVNGACNINVYAGVFTDAATNTNTASVFTWTKTGVTPTVIITSSIANNSSTTTSSLPITFTTSSSTLNFIASDVVVTGGAISGFTGSGTTYTATFTASDTGVKTIIVPENSFTNSDIVGNEKAQFAFARVFLSPPAPVGWSLTPAVNFVKRGVLRATIKTENEQSSSLTDKNFYYENGVISADVLPDGSAVNGIEMIGTQIEIDLEFTDNSTADVIESVMIGTWNSLGH